MLSYKHRLGHQAELEMDPFVDLGMLDQEAGCSMEACKEF